MHPHIHTLSLLRTVSHYYTKSNQPKTLSLFVRMLSLESVSQFCSTLKLEQDVKLCQGNTLQTNINFNLSKFKCITFTIGGTRASAFQVLEGSVFSINGPTTS